MTGQDCSLYTVGRLEDRHYAFAFPKGQHHQHQQEECPHHQQNHLLGLCVCKGQHNPNHRYELGMGTSSQGLGDRQIFLRVPFILINRNFIVCTKQSETVTCDKAKEVFPHACLPQNPNHLGPSSNLYIPHYIPKCLCFYLTSCLGVECTSFSSWASLRKYSILRLLLH